MEKMNSTVQWDFFVAHANADGTIAEKLFEALSTTHRVFLDKKSVSAGGDRDLEISRALGRSQIILVLVSSKVEASYYLRDEIATAIQLTRTNHNAHRVVVIF